MVRGRLKSAVASVARLTGADRIYGGWSGQRREAVVLGYHRVVENFDREAAYAFPSMLISRVMFERHLDWMAQHFEIVPLDELRMRLDTFAPRARPLAAITFDDGYRDVYEQAFPLLKSKGIPAAVFVATDYVGTSRVLPHDRLYLLLGRASRRWSAFTRRLTALVQRLGLALPAARPVATASLDGAFRTLITSLSQADVLRLITALEVDCGLAGGMPNGFRPMTWSMVTEMSRAGMVVGSHTKSHCLLTNEHALKVAEEASGSQQALTAALGRPVSCFAYPDGRFDPAAVRAIAAAGYRIAVTTCRHRDPDHPWLTVPRLLLWERSSVDSRGQFSAAVLGCQVNGLFNRVSACRQSHRMLDSADRSYGERRIRAHRFQGIASFGR